MRKTQAAEILARRLGTDARRIDTLCLRLAETGAFPRSDGSRRFPPELDPPHLARMIVVALSDQGLGRVHGAVRTIENLRDPEGNRLVDVLTSIIEGGSSIGSIARGHLIVRTEPAGASIILDGQHVVFGAPPPETKPARAVGVPGNVLAAVALEFGGHSPKDADAIVALAQITPLSSAASQAIGNSM